MKAGGFGPLWPTGVYYFIHSPYTAHSRARAPARAGPCSIKALRMRYTLALAYGNELYGHVQYVYVHRTVELGYRRQIKERKLYKESRLLP